MQGTTGSFSASQRGLPQAGTYTITVTFTYRLITNPNQKQTSNPALTGSALVKP
jgi:hypothetical protein